MPCLTDADNCLELLHMGNICCTSSTLPFFMQDEVFTNFRYDNYTWNFRRPINVIVRKRAQTSQLKEVEPNSYNGNRAEANLKIKEDVESGGCPLECPFDPNENFEEVLNEQIELEHTFSGFNFDKTKYEAVGEEDCRKIFLRASSAYMTKKDVGLDFSRSFWIPCEPRPITSQTVMWGYTPGQGQSHDIRMIGPLDRNSPQLTLDYLKSLHKKVQNSVVPQNIHSQVHVLYEKTHGEFKADGKVFMEYVWHDPRSLFETPPVSNARVKLVVQPCFGDANPFLVQMWQEMSILEKTVSEVKKADMNLDLHMSQLTLLGTSDPEAKSPVVKKMIELLHQPSVPNWKKGIDYSDSLETVLKRVVDVDRSDADFTDQAWLILKDATSLQELYECVHSMFAAVESKAYRPYLLPSNKTLLGRLLTKMLSNEIVNFRTILTIRLAIEITLDCGLNKIFKDYSFILGMCHLAEPDETEDFSPKSDPDQFKRSLTDLKKLHCILEVLCLTRERIALSMSELEVQAGKLLKFFRKNELDESGTYHFDVPLSSVAPAVHGLHPVYWKLRTESSTLLKTTRNSMILTRDMYFDHAKKFFTLSEDGSLPRGYFLYICRESSLIKS